jgi:hypothetical protein
MATYATTAERWLADEWEKVYASAVLSGIVGDLAHKARGGYHISIQDQPSTNYSVIRTDDKAPPGNWARDRASAIDMTMNTADMKKCHVRLRDIWKNRSRDPRMKYINAWNGWDGEGDAGRYDVVTGKVTTATPDHKWHIHLEIRRRYVNDMNAMRAILSMLKGQSLAAYQESLSPPPATPTTNGGTTVADQFSTEDEAVLRASATTGVLSYAGGGLPSWAEQPANKNFLNAFTEMFNEVQEQDTDLDAMQAALVTLSAMVASLIEDVAAIRAVVAPAVPPTDEVPPGSTT